MRSEKIAEKIMTQAHEGVKDFISEIIADHRTVDFGKIEEKVQQTIGRRSFGSSRQWICGQDNRV